MSKKGDDERRKLGLSLHEAIERQDSQLDRLERELKHMRDGRRFQAAVAAMQGLLAAVGAEREFKAAEIAHDAVLHADALLAALEVER
jgi:hypothetical protein